MGRVDRDLRDWLRGLAAPPSKAQGRDDRRELSRAGAEYLERIATDGTLKAALTEIGAAEPELAG